MMRAVCVVAVVLMAGLAGCAEGDRAPALEPPLDAPSEALLDALPVEELFVAASDGTRLHQAVYRPDTNESVPVFINFSPYWGDTAELGGDGFGQYLIEHLVPRGYAVVLSAIRGTGHSEGCFEVASDREVQDLYEVIDHFAQAEWSNGAVAAGGKSYDSTTQNGLIAKMPHPALEAVFHVSGITDMYRYNYVGGVPYSNGLTFTPRYATQYSMDGSHPEGDIQQLLDMTCPEMAEHAASGTGSAATGLKDDYWVERDWTRYIGDSEWDGSIFFVHGFQDWNVKPDHILPWISNLPDQVRVKGWLHQDTYNSGHVYPMRDDWNATFVAWLDTELKDKDLGFWQTPAWDIEATDGVWRGTDVWPPERVELARDETTTAVSIPGPGTAYWTFNETHAVRLTGAPTVHVDAVVADPEAVLTAVLYKESDGQRTWIGEAVLRAIYADGTDAPSPAAGEARYALTAYPLDVVFGPGDRLVARLGEEPTKSLVTQPQIRGAVYWTDEVVLEASLASAAARSEQPQATPCFAC